MLGDLGLHVHGYRTRTSAAGQHVIAIRALNLTLGVSERVVERLDQLRKLRNAVEYSGEAVSTPALTECLQQAGALRQLAREWLEKNRVELL
jgi:hypothetical protein